METMSLTRRLETSALVVGALALGAVASGCGREPSMASKSATAYQEAVEQGLPVGSGHGGHGGSAGADHSGTTPPNEHFAEGAGAITGAETAPLRGMDYSTHAANEPAAPMDPSHHAGSAPMAGRDRSRPTGGTTDPMAGRDHSHTAKPAQAIPMDHSQHAGENPEPTSGMDHSKPVERTATPKAGMDHAAMGHGSPAPNQEPLLTPTSSSALGQLDPARTLTTDEFDQVVAPPSTGATEQGVKKEKP